MMAKFGILTIHGMGRQGPNFDRGLRERLSRRFDQGTHNDVVFEPVFYQDLLQANEERVWADMDLAGGWVPAAVAQVLGQGPQILPVRLQRRRQLPESPRGGWQRLQENPH